MTKVEDVTIIGAGPAGLSAALQLKRYGINPLLLERSEMGGLLKNANLVENYPGYPGGIPGLELVELFKKHVKSLSVKTTFEEVEELTYEGQYFQVRTPVRNYNSQVVVIASGTKPKKFRDFSIPASVQDRFYYEVYPLLQLKNKRIAIIGAGDAAFDYGLNLARHNEVIILNRGESVSCLPLLWERAKVSPGITYKPGTRVVKIADDSKSGLSIAFRDSNGVYPMRVDYLIAAIGREARLDYVSSQLMRKFQELEDRGVLYLIGDVTNGIYRQTSIAVGNGIMAAMKIYQYLRELAL